MICKLCKKSIGLNKITETFSICDKCLLDIQLSFSYYINGKEVTRDTYLKGVNYEK